jgi:hypothetical protein
MSNPIEQGTTSPPVCTCRSELIFENQFAMNADVSLSNAIYVIVAGVRSIENSRLTQFEGISVRRSYLHFSLAWPKRPINNTG